MRSGSTLLCDLLSKTQCAGRPNEFFLSNWEDKNPLDKTNYSDFIRQTMVANASQNGVSGVKIMWPTFEKMLQKLRGNKANSSVSDLELLENALPNLQFIFISRHDKLRQAISLSRSIKSKQWNKFIDKRDGKVSWNKFSDAAKPKSQSYPYISPLQINGNLKLLQKNETNWREFLNQHNIQPYQVSYESLCANQLETIKGILAYLDIPDSQQPITIESNFKKQADIYTELLILQHRLYQLLKRITPELIRNKFYVRGKVI